MKPFMQVRCEFYDDTGSTMGRFLSLPQRLFQPDLIPAICNVLFVSLPALMFVDVATMKHQSCESDILDANSALDIYVEDHAENFRCRCKVVKVRALEPRLASRR